jgi:hypothetical protein
MNLKRIKQPSIYFDLFKYIAFVMHLNTYYVQVHCKSYTSRKFKIKLLDNF